MGDGGMLPSVSKITSACAHITELCQQVFIYNEEAHCTSHTTCAQVFELGALCGVDVYVICRCNL